MVRASITDIGDMHGPQHNPNPRVVPRTGSSAPPRPRPAPSARPARPARAARPKRPPAPPKPRFVFSPRLKAARRSVLRFVLVFMGVFALFYAATLVERHLLGNRVWSGYLHANAVVAGAFLNHFDQYVAVEGDIINSSRATLKVAMGCDAAYPTALFAAAAIAMPFIWPYRLLGVLFGAFMLGGLNIIRILTLYYIRAEHPTIFNVVHIDVWQALFIFITVLLWIMWAYWAARRTAGALE